MNSLLKDALEAHGGLDRWNTHKTLTAKIVTAGAFWALKDVVQDRDERTMVVDLHRQWGSLEPYGAPGQRSDFTPGRVAVVAPDGALVAERLDPRAAFEGHELTSPWDPLHRAYFNGYALWIYLTMPFSLAMDGVEVVEIDDWAEGGERWRGLRATFPEGFAGHSREQDFYFGPDGLLRRHDYTVDISGGFAAAHYISDPVRAEGIVAYRRRRAYRRGDNMKPILDPPMVTIDLSGFRFDAPEAEAHRA